MIGRHASDSSSQGLAKSNANAATLTHKFRASWSQLFLMELCAGIPSRLSETPAPPLPLFAV